MSKRKSYGISFKLKVMDYAEADGNRFAESEFDVSEKVVKEKQKEQFKDKSNSKRAVKFAVSLYQNLEKEPCN